ncbi:MauE/DoxX family redox-associated membrane protein [Actinokineospora enzanensis]|uniref:MauE/DoxX family redox-associated membrane protein n=1 Tax=Actinokineospora enzanensis TaxID=155975 RepID=UPI0012EC582F|nr:MauE/DoxX family redox-associated membrane protein [Actinokineospora enzanensis]
MGFVVFARALMVVLFAAAVVGKVASRRRWRAFVVSIEALRVVPGRVTRAVAVGTLGLEGCVAVGVGVSGTHRVGLGVAGVALLGFAGLAVSARRRGVRAPCACFGGGSRPLGYAHAVRDVALGVIAGVAVVVDTGGGVSFESGLVAVAGATVVGAVAVLFDDLLDLGSGLHTPAGR